MLRSTTSRSTAEDSLKYLLADISTLTSTHPTEKLASVLDEIFLASSSNAKPSPTVVPTTSQMNRVVRGKSIKKNHGTCCKIVLLFLAVACSSVAITSGIIKGGQLYYGKNEIFYVAVQLLNSPILNGFLPEDSRTNIASSMQTAYTLLLQQLKSFALNAGLHNWDDSFNCGQPCILPNPLYVEPEREKYSCSQCSIIKHILATKFDLEQQPASYDLLLSSQPIIFRRWGTNVTMAELQTQVLNNSHILENFPDGLFSDTDYISHITHLGSDDVISRLERDAFAHVTWISEHYMTSQVLRKLFKRPKFIQEDMVIELSKILLIDGQSSPSYILPWSAAENESLWYAQGSGSRTLVLTPRDGCMDVCPILRARLHPSDILVFNPYVWSTSSMPDDASSSLAMVGCFS